MDDKKSTVGSVVLLVLGVIIPLGAIVFELLTRMCAEVFFDPLPTLGHVIAVFLVPSVNLLVWLHLLGKPILKLRWLALLNAVVLGISFYYTLLYLPIVPLALIAVVIYGLGLLPLAPAFSFISAILLRRRLKRAAAPEAIPLFLAGALVGFLLLPALYIPHTITRIGQAMAVSDNEENATKGIRWLRSIGNDDAMLSSCYRRSGSPFDLLVELVIGENLSTEEARTIYYRVTGIPFNAVEPPPLRAGLYRWSGTDRFDFNPEADGKVIPGRLRGLSLVQSRLDGSINADDALAYLEWTMVFQNTSSMQEEASATIALPPEGVVSRLTLWIDGEPREAAFGGRSQTREAYQKVVRKKRDPVLVTTAGPDRVFMQCFPVPPGKGEMKIRIGITSPLILDKPENGVYLLPRFVHRNFAIKKTLTHAVWLAGKRKLDAVAWPLKTKTAADDTYELRGALSQPQLDDVRGHVTVTRDPNVRTGWADDHVDPVPHRVTQKLIPRTPRAAKRFHIVIDGSLGMARYKDDVGNVLKAAPKGSVASVRIASDEVIARSSASASTEFAAHAFEGGQDNMPALMAALEEAANAAGEEAVLWLHAPAYANVGSTASVVQFLERSTAPPRLFMVQTTTGPNSVGEALAALPSVKRVVRRGSLRDDLARLLEQGHAALGAWQAVRDRIPAPASTLSDTNADMQKEASDTTPEETAKILEPESEPTSSASQGKGSRHLVRLWAHDTVLAALAENESAAREAALKRAVAYQLVTPISGAVVLEAQKQYQEAGLAPVSSDTVPSVPEPEIWMLIALLVALAGIVLARQCRRRVHS